MSDWSLIRDQIKARVRLSEIVGKKVAFDRRKSHPARGEFWACCPFHSEKSASFHVLDREGYYKCFGCGAGGDHVNFIMETENRSYRETMEMLAEMAGLELPAPSPEAERKARERASLHDVLERAAKFFERSLASKEGAEARGYLERRGLPRDIWARFRLGYAPGGGHALIDEMIASGIGHDQMREVGLLSSNEEPRDLFRNRLIFPITDGRGRVIAFGGRALGDDQQPKYLNSPETPVFSKSHTLYNLANARKRTINPPPQVNALSAPAGHLSHERVKNHASLIVAEGYMDVIALTRAGFERSVAPLGTALTAEHLDLLWSIEPSPIIAFDGDVAGRAAAARALDRALSLLKPGRTLSFAFLPEGQDPDDLMRSGGPAAVARALEKTEPLAEVLWQIKTQAVDVRTPDGRAAAEAAMREAVSQIGDLQVRRHYESFVRERVSQWLRTARPAFAAKDGARRPPATVVPARPTAELRWRAHRASVAAEETLVLALLTHPEVAADFAEDLVQPLQDKRLEAVKAHALAFLAATPTAVRSELEAALEPAHGPVVRGLLAREGLKCLPCSNPAAEPAAVRASFHELLETLASHRAEGETAAALQEALEGELSSEAWERAKALHRERLNQRKS